METIFIKATEISPEVIFNPSENKYSISGWSRPEIAAQFYEPIERWIDQCGEKYLNNASIDFDLEYFDTPSARELGRIMEQLEILHRKGIRVSINWHYDDEESKEEFYDEFARGLTLPVHFIQKK
jgi:hypothetical protein